MKYRFFIILIIAILSAPNMVFAQIPTVAPSNIKATIQKITTTVKDIQTKVVSCTIVTKTAAAIGSVKNSISSYVSKAQEKIEKAKEKIAKYKEKAEKYKAKIEKAKAKVAKAKAKIEKAKAKIEKAKAKVNQVKGKIDNAKNKISNLKGTVEGAINKAKNEVGDVKGMINDVKGYAKETVDYANKTVDYAKGTADYAKGTVDYAKNTAQTATNVVKSEGNVAGNQGEVNSGTQGVSYGTSAATVSKNSASNMVSSSSSAADIAPSRKPIIMPETLQQQAQTVPAGKDDVSLSDSKQKENEAVDGKSQFVEKPVAEEKLDGKLSSDNEYLEGEEKSFEQKSNEEKDILEKNDEQKINDMKKQAQPTRSTFKTSMGYGSLHNSMTFAFADMMDIVTGETEEGVPIINDDMADEKSLAEVCNLDYKSAAEEGRLTGCLEDLNAIKTAEDIEDKDIAQKIEKYGVSKEEADILLRNDYMQDLAVKYLEALNIYNESLDFKNKFVDPIMTQQIKENTNAIRMVKEMQQILGNRMSDLSKLHARWLAVRMKKTYLEYSFLPNSAEED